MKKIPIKLHTSNALRWLGSLYRNPADAIKEHVSNAIDEHNKARHMGMAVQVCEVVFTMEKKAVTIEYPYGMSREEFENALQRVADSAKRSLDFRLIGQLGIGMFSFLQIGRKCVFYSKKGKGYENIKVTLREGSDQAEFETPRKKESIYRQGIRVVISELKFDPTKPRGPLSPARLQRVFAEKFDKFLKSGSLKIEVRCNGQKYAVKPLKIDFPRVGEAYEVWHLPRDRSKHIALELYFDPSGKGTVSIRHMGVTIVEDIRAIDAYGLEESVYASGYVKGSIDADFLEPLPARTGFEENHSWIDFLDVLDQIRPAIQAEVEKHRLKEAAEKLAEVQKKAIELARDILNTDEFGDLELLEGLGRKRREPKLPPNGFDFFPSSMRIDQGKTGHIRLKALVPEVVPDNSLVSFSVSDTAVELKTQSVLLKASDADKNGVVSAPVAFLAKSHTKVPVILTATTGALEAKARIRVAEFKLTRELSAGKEGEGQGINYREVPFEDGPTRHSRYISRLVEINELNEDYKREVLEGSDRQQLSYAAMMIGKETIAFNDKTGNVDEYLEKILSFYFRLKNRMGQSSTRVVRRMGGGGEKKA